MIDRSPLLPVPGQSSPSNLKTVLLETLDGYAAQVWESTVRGGRMVLKVSSRFEPPAFFYAADPTEALAIARDEIARMRDQATL